MPNKVYVINKHGRPLMPCSPAKARHLLDEGKAKVKKRTPLPSAGLPGSSGYTQEVILGVDAGSKTIGMSASTTKEELLSAEVKPRNDVVDLLSTPSRVPQSQRNRKTRYRKSRFDNRVQQTTRDGWRLLWRSNQEASLPSRSVPYPARQQSGHRDRRVRPADAESHCGWKARSAR